MLKRVFTAIAGVALLAAAGATDSRAAGLGDIGNTLILETGDPLVTVVAGSSTGTGNGSVIDIFGTFFAGGTSEDGDGVDINNAGLSLSLLVTETELPFGTQLIGEEEDSAYTEDTNGDDLIEILFSLTGGSLSTAPFVLASITGEFGSDPFGTSGPSTLTAIFGNPAKITLTNVSQIPLPAGMVLLLSALGGLVLVRRRTA